MGGNICKKLIVKKMVSDLEETTLRIMETNDSLGISIMESVKGNPLRVFIIINDKESRSKGMIVLTLNDETLGVIIEHSSFVGTVAMLEDFFDIAKLVENEMILAAKSSIID